jgi:hypothetical protein
MLNSSNSGQYLCRQYNDQRSQAFEESSGFSTTELAYLEISFPDGAGNFHDDDFLIATDPVSQNIYDAPKSRFIDFRSRPECSD